MTNERRGELTKAMDGFADDEPVLFLQGWSPAELTCGELRTLLASAPSAPQPTEVERLKTELAESKQRIGQLFDRFADAVVALDQYRRSSMASTLQAIDNAPKDGTPVKLRWEGSTVEAIGRWGPACASNPHDDETGWRDVKEGTLLPHPSHWLPMTPSASQEEPTPANFGLIEEVRMAERLLRMKTGGWSDDGPTIRRAVDVLHRVVEALSSSAPVETTTDCRTDEGVTVGLIDSIITAARVLATRNLSGSAITEALKDMRSDGDVRRMLAPAQTQEERANRFDCPQCGQGIAVDEDGCCRSCGADAKPVLAQPSPETPASLADLTPARRRELERSSARERAKMRPRIDAIRESEAITRDDLDTIVSAETPEATAKAIDLMDALRRALPKGRKDAES